MKGDPPAVGADSRDPAAPIGLPALAVDADADGLPRLPVVDEDVDILVGIAVHQVGGVGTEAHETAVSAETGGCAASVGLAAPAVDAHPGGLPRLPVMDEDVRHPIGVAVHQVGGERLEGHVSAPAVYAATGAASVGLAAPAVGAHPSGFPGLPVVDKDIGGFVAVAVHQVGGKGLEGDEASAATEAGNPAGAVALDSAVGKADPGGPPRLPVVDEDVQRSVGVAVHQVGGEGLESDEASAVADPRKLAQTVALVACVVDADPDGLARPAVVHEDVRHPVGVAVHQVGSGRRVDDEVSVGADLGVLTGTVSPVGPVDADPGGRLGGKFGGRQDQGEEQRESGENACGAPSAPNRFAHVRIRHDSAIIRSGGGSGPIET